MTHHFLVVHPVRFAKTIFPIWPGAKYLFLVQGGSIFSTGVCLREEGGFQWRIEYLVPVSRVTGLERRPSKNGIVAIREDSRATFLAPPGSYGRESIESWQGRH